MIHRRIVRAVIAAAFAVSAAAWSGWFVDSGEAAEEVSVNEQVWLAPSPEQAAAVVMGQAIVGAGQAVDIHEQAGTVQTDAAADKQGANTMDNHPIIIKAAAALGEQPSISSHTVTASDMPNGRTVYLTFDDGPSKLTSEVLDILKKEGIQATFFVLGEQVDEHPELLKRIVKEGHTVGNHTYDHEYKSLYNSFGEFAAQIVKTEEAMEAAAGIRTKLVRAPGGTFGNFDQSYFDAMKQAGYTMFDWNVDSGDSVRVGVPAAEIVKNIHNSKLSDKTVVLLHDSSIHGESVKALPDIIRYYKGQGYTFAPLTEAVEPVTFRLADKLKWSRPEATSAEEQAARQGLMTKGTSTFVFSGDSGKHEVSGATSTEAWGTTDSAVQGGRELIVFAADRTLLFEPGAYWATSEGDWLVPLRDMIEGLGGKLSWNASERNVHVVLSDSTTFDLAAGAGQPGIIKQGKVYASLREVLLHIEGKNAAESELGNHIVFGDSDKSTAALASDAA